MKHRISIREYQPGDVQALANIYYGPVGKCRTSRMDFQGSPLIQIPYSKKINLLYFFVYCLQISLQLFLFHLDSLHILVYSWK